uniref:Uncharacterized protein n=1 Tax=Pseudomonas putida TaxID=303 RepID=C7T576_PSEPU|nr:hypothetical protein [Pseudomonas putida]ACU65276.1 unknown [Pseudomonas putida]
MLPSASNWSSPSGDITFTVLEDPLYAPKTELERRAYEEGVTQVLTDLKGKMRARDRFTWDPPIIQCGVDIPARVQNGMLVPGHKECVQIAPGRWTEEAPTYLPVLGN